MNKEKAIKLAKKLKALAERGIEGEKNNARVRLDALLKQYGLEEYQIIEGLRTFERTTLNEGSVILERIIKSVNPDAQIMVKQFKTKLILEVILSDIEYREIRQKYKFFWRAYNRERKLLLTSFFNRHYAYFSTIKISSSAHGGNKSGHPFQKDDKSVALQKSAQKSESQSSSTSGQSSSHTPNPDGFRGRPLTFIEEDKVRAFMQILARLDYAKIPEMQDADSPSDMEYKESPNQQN